MILILGTIIGLQGCNWIVTRVLPTQAHHDHVVGQVVGAGFQATIISIALWMMYNQINTVLVPSLLFGYFVYDLIDLLRKPDWQTLYIVHHIISLLLMLFIKVFTDHNDIFYPMIVLLESSTLTMNIGNLLKQVVSPVYYKLLNLLNIVVYGITRVLLFPVWIYYYGSRAQIFDSVIGITLVLFIAAYGMFLVWFYKFLLKYLRK